MRAGCRVPHPTAGRLGKRKRRRRRPFLCYRDTSTPACSGISSSVPDRSFSPHHSVILRVTEGGAKDPLYLSFDTGAKRRSTKPQPAAQLLPLVLPNGRTSTGARQATPALPPHSFDPWL